MLRTGSNALPPRLGHDDGAKEIITAFHIRPGLAEKTAASLFLPTLIYCSDVRMPTVNVVITISFGEYHQGER